MSSSEARQLQLRVQRIRELSGRTDPRAIELQRQVKSALRTAGLREFPYDLDRLATSLGVQRIVRRPLGIRGRLIELDGEVAVEIDDVLAPQEARFVLAHELAHLIVEPMKAKGRASGSDRPLEAKEYKSIERYCDFVAEELVLPGDIAIDALGDTAALSIAISYSEELCVPLRIVLSRALLEGKWDGQAVLWIRRGRDHSPDRLRPKWIVPARVGVGRNWTLIVPPVGGVWEDLGTVFQVDVDLEDSQGAIIESKVQAVAYDSGEFWTLLPTVMSRRKGANHSGR